MRVLVCGDRAWDDRERIETRLAELPHETVIVEGGAPGADSLAREIATSLGMVTETHPADWPRYGRGAGPKRNQEMLDSGVGRVIAFHRDLGRSRGTADMVRRAKRAGIPVEVIG